MVRSDIMENASIGLLSEEDICQCPVREITESNIDSVSTGIAPSNTIGIQKKTPVLCNSDGYLFIYVNSNYDICICKEEDGMVHTIRVLKGHSHPVLQLLYNEELYHLFSCGSDGLFFWDLNRDSEPVQIVTSDITCMCFILERKGIAVGTSNGTIQLFDGLNQYCEMDSIPAHKSEITNVKWIENKNLLVTSSRDSTIAVWNLQSFLPSYQSLPKSAQLLTILQGHQGDVTVLTSTEDGEFVISGGRDHSIRVWKIATGKCVRCIEDTRSILGKHNGEITYIECIENDSMLISASTDGKLKCFSLAPFTDDPLQTQTLHSFTTIEDLFSSFGDDQTLMDVNSLTNIDSIRWNHAFPETNGIVHVCHNSNFSRFFVSSLDHAFFIYSTSLKDSTFAVVHSFVAHSSDITDVVCDYQNSLISVSSDHHMIVTDLSSYTTTLDIDCGFALSTLTSYGEWIVTAGSSYSVLFISLACPSRRVDFNGHVGKITTLAVNSTLGLLISGGYDSQVLLHCIPDLSQSSLSISPLCSVSCHDGIITSVDLSSSINNSFYAASGGNDYAIIVYSVKDTSLHSCWEIPNAHSGIVTSVLFGSGMGTGMLYSGGMDCSIKVWNVLAKELVGELRYHSSKVVSLCQSSDGRYLVSASADRVVFMYDISKNFEVVHRLETKEEPACMTFHHTSLVIGMKSGGCQLWNIQLSFVCEKHDKWIIA